MSKGQKLEQKESWEDLKSFQTKAPSSCSAVHQVITSSVYKCRDIFKIEWTRENHSNGPEMSDWAQAIFCMSTEVNLASLTLTVTQKIQTINKNTSTHTPNNHLSASWQHTSFPLISCTETAKCFLVCETTTTATKEWTWFHRLKAFLSQLLIYI